MSNGNEGVLRIPQGASITRTLPSECLVSYLGHSVGIGLITQQRCSQDIVQPQPTGQYTELNVKTVLFQTIQFSISTQFNLKIVLFRTIHFSTSYGDFYQPRKDRFIPTFSKRINCTSTAVGRWVTAFEDRRRTTFSVTKFKYNKQQTGFYTKWNKQRTCKSSKRSSMF